MRTPFDANGDAKIVGGTFALKSTVSLVTGMFTGGTVDGPPPSSTPCVHEVLDVTGLLTATSGGTGTFKATLTHFRRSIFGQCRTLGATVAGVVSLTLGP